MHLSVDRAVGSGTTVAHSWATKTGMLRISKTTASEGGVVVLKLDGQVMGPWVNELRRACTESLGSGPTPNAVVLDLAGVGYIDADGLGLFRELAERGVSSTNPSVFVAEQLKEVSQ